MQVRPGGHVQGAGLSSAPLVPICFPSILGSPFCLLEHRAGHIHRSVSLPAVPPRQRPAWYGAMAQVLARIHSLDLGAAELQDLGEHGESSLWILSSSGWQHFKGWAGWTKLGTGGKGKMSSPESESPGVVGGCEEFFKSRFPVSSQNSPSSQSFLPCLLPSVPTVATGVASLLPSLTKRPQASPPVSLQLPEAGGEVTFLSKIGLFPPEY